MFDDSQCFDNINSDNSVTVYSTTTCDDKMASVIDDSYWPWSQCFDYINSLVTESGV